MTPATREAIAAAMDRAHEPSAEQKAVIAAQLAPAVAASKTQDAAKDTAA